MSRRTFVGALSRILPVLVTARCIRASHPWRQTRDLSAVSFVWSPPAGCGDARLCVLSFSMVSDARRPELPSACATLLATASRCRFSRVGWDHIAKLTFPFGYLAVKPAPQRVYCRASRPKGSTKCFLESGNGVINSTGTQLGAVLFLTR